MHWNTVIATLCVVVYVCAGDLPRRPPDFNVGYHAKGTLFISSAGIYEPFEAWYDPLGARSRIDYYHGVVKTFQTVTSTFYVPSLDQSYVRVNLRKIIPVTKENELNVMTCFEFGDNGEQLQSVLPNMEAYQFAGEGKIKGVECEIWKSVVTEGNATSRYTVWLQVEEGTNGSVEAIPLRYEARGELMVINRGSYDHYFLDYDAYDAETPNISFFEIPEGMVCHPDPRYSPVSSISFNPMREYVHGYDKHVDEEFDRFRAEHSRSYGHPEHLERKEIFRQNLRFINSKNRAGLGFSLAVNHLADLTPEELSRMQRGLLRGPEREGPVLSGAASTGPDPWFPAASTSLPESVDWRQSGAVTPVKNQALCGSCWSYGVTGAIEGAHFLKYGKLVRLSQQALVDCSWGEGVFGCSGAQPTKVYEWIKKHGVPEDADYGPYLAQEGLCHMNQVKSVVNITGWGKVLPLDSDALKQAVAAKGPIAVGMNVASRTILFYSDGIYNDFDCDPEILNHAVLVVGYGAIGDQPYWIVKNSWSSQWGKDGYMLVSMGGNDCGITKEPTFVEL